MGATTVDTTAEDMVIHMVDTAMDITAEKRGPLKQNQKQKPAQMPGMDTEDMVDIMVATTAEVMATHMVDTAMDIVVMATHMVDTDTTVECHAIETVPAKTTLPY